MRSLLFCLLCVTSLGCFAPRDEAPSIDPGQRVPGPDAGRPTAPDDGGAVAGDAGAPVEPDAGGLPPPAPVTTVVDALAVNPPAATSQADGTPIDGGCRGDAFLLGARRPTECAVGPCLGIIGRDGTTRVFERSPSVSVIGAEAQRLAWVRSENRRLTLFTQRGAAPATVVATLGEGLGQLQALFDGDDVVVVRSVVAGASARTSVTRFFAGQPESAAQLAYEGPGRIERSRDTLGRGEPQLDLSTGRVWVLTTGGLFRTAPRGQTGGAAVPLPPGAQVADVGAFALAGRGLALVAIGSQVWRTDGTAALLEHLASLPDATRITAIAPYGTGFAATAAGSVFVLDGAGPIRRVLGRTNVSPYATTESAIAVEGRRVFVNTLCLSWSSYPGYDVAVIEPDVAQPVARWWWEVYGSQHDLPVIPSSRVNVSGDQWVSVELVRANGGFVTSRW
ncbi:MAG: hypothetical protein INH41_23385 [Myxococcaceae bacterium]|jgi:hypothetical protein|nr:hypothetical protein [Myxococcaceae bacterium]MCA3015342.1 hypothetical protein [Myxococcaceae bacterium]